MSAAALAMGAVAVGCLLGFWVALRHSQRLLDDAYERAQKLTYEYQAMLKTASEANITIADRVMQLEDRVNFFLQAAQPKR